MLALALQGDELETSRANHLQQYLPSPPLTSNAFSPLQHHHNYRRHSRLAHKSASSTSHHTPTTLRAYQPRPQLKGSCRSPLHYFREPNYHHQQASPRFLACQSVLKRKERRRRKSLRTTVMHPHLPLLFCCTRSISAFCFFCLLVLSFPPYSCRRCLFSWISRTPPSPTGVVGRGRGVRGRRRRKPFFFGRRRTLYSLPLFLLEEKIKAIIFEGFVMPSLFEKALV